MSLIARTEGRDLTFEKVTEGPNKRVEKEARNYLHIIYLLI